MDRQDNWHAVKYVFVQYPNGVKQMKVYGMLGALEQFSDKGEEWLRAGKRSSLNEHDR